MSQCLYDAQGKYTCIEKFSNIEECKELRGDKINKDSAMKICTKRCKKSKYHNFKGIWFNEPSTQNGICMCCPKE